MDNAFPTAFYPSMTKRQLLGAIAAGRGTHKMVNEVRRRDAVAAGDLSQATYGERLRILRTVEA